MNRQWWPTPVAGAGLACGVWVAAWRRRAVLVTLGLLAGAWAAVALLHFRDAFAAIHWLGAWWMGAFLLQSLLWLVWAALTRPVFDEDGQLRTAGLLLLVAAAAWPLLTLVLQQPL